MCQKSKIQRTTGLQSKKEVYDTQVLKSSIRSKNGNDLDQRGSNSNKEGAGGRSWAWLDWEDVRDVLGTQTQTIQTDSFNLCEAKFQDLSKTSTVNHHASHVIFEPLSETSPVLSHSLQHLKLRPSFHVPPMSKLCLSFRIPPICHLPHVPSALYATFHSSHPAFHPLQNLLLLAPHSLSLFLHLVVAAATSSCIVFPTST
ncbi:uncharacterized protein F5147DRAFT_654116 [Suillus discolor]|uniref:Uncharacterized protein n=1 Tax=Suillus discolor TaxID=1912936 RepID=A0A9P7JSJ7_9AGAM|nr:uncharacterized protein F5147DRAFT_654116 [Suillus discolor]KAG2105438.1 hypothetical protein F5147DRAFT_654116 [Suillus discolor]